MILSKFNRLIRTSKSSQIGVQIMLKNFSLEYWTDDNWYVGRLKGIPGIFSQGETLEEIEDNIKDAYELMMEEESFL